MNRPKTCESCRDLLRSLTQLSTKLGEATWVDKDLVGLCAVQDFVHCEWDEIVNAINTAELEHIMFTFSDGEMPFTKWDWVDEWVKRREARDFSFNNKEVK